MSPLNVCPVLISVPKQTRRVTCSTLFLEDDLTPPLDTNPNHYLMESKTKSQDIRQLGRELIGLRKRENEGEVERKSVWIGGGPALTTRQERQFTQKGNTFPSVLPPASSFRPDHSLLPGPSHPHHPCCTQPP